MMSLSLCDGEIMPGSSTENGTNLTCFFRPMTNNGAKTKTPLSETQARAIDNIVVSHECFSPVAIAVSEFKSKISGRHSLGPGPGSLFAMIRKIVDPSFKEFIQAFPCKLPQNTPVLSKLIRESPNPDLALNNLALTGRTRGTALRPTLKEILTQPSTGTEFDADDAVIVSTIDTLRYMVAACGVFRQKQKRKFTPQGEGRKSNAREWAIKRSKVIEASEVDAIKSRALSCSVYPYCRFCYRYSEHYQSQIAVKKIDAGMGKKIEIEPLPTHDDRDHRIRPDQSQEYCSLHRNDRNARDRDRHMQPVYFGLLVAMYWLKGKRMIQYLDEEELREFAYQEARHRSPCAKKVASLLKQNPEISDKELGQELAEVLLHSAET